MSMYPRFFSYFSSSRVLLGGIVLDFFWEGLFLIYSMRRRLYLDQGVAASETGERDRLSLVQMSSRKPVMASAFVGQILEKILGL